MWQYPVWGTMNLSMNGEKVGNRFLAPGWTQYDKTCLYNMYEVTDQIQEGKNALGAIVGCGFYNINHGALYKIRHYLRLTHTYL